MDPSQPPAADRAALPPVLSPFWKSPALTHRSPHYPSRYADRVPMLIKMLRTVDPDYAWIIKTPEGTEAKYNHTYPAWTNMHGAVAACLPNGQQLGVKPEAPGQAAEFEVTHWFWGIAGYLTWPQGDYSHAMLCHHAAQSFLLLTGLASHSKVYGVLLPPAHPLNPVEDRLVPESLMPSPDWRTRAFFHVHDQETAQHLQQCLDDYSLDHPGIELTDLAGHPFATRNDPTPPLKSPI